MQENTTNSSPKKPKRNWLINAAGAAAAFWSDNPQLSASGVRAILFEKAQNYKDWGTSGDDYIFGRGGLFLYDNVPNAIYILEHYLNPFNSAALPYHSIQQANTQAPSNSNAVFLGSHHVAPSAGNIINKPMLYKAAAKNAIID